MQNYDHPDLLNAIDTEQYYQFPGTNTVVCCIKTRSRWTFTGTSTCFSDHKFDYELGAERARDNAMSQLRRAWSFAKAEERAR